MSRLIFEGDTTDRFGKLFPKPFIQEIRVYDDLIQADVMLFFEVPLGDDSSAALIAKISDNLRVFGAFLERDQFNRTINPNSQNEFYKNSFFTLNFNQNDFKKIEPLNNIEYHYNSEGKRFAKCLVTFNYSGIASFLGIERDRYFATFTSFTTPASELEQLGTTDQAALLNAKDYQNTLLRNQTSDLVYEKIFNADNTLNTLNTGKQNVYQQPDGNYYGKTPLQSLGKTYKQADRVTHRNILQIINPIISPYAGSNEEANKVSVTLSQYANDPMLLTQLEKDIKSFTNKSSTTTTGQLYGELVRAVADIDNLLQNEPTLDKRLETNTKIKDKRGVQQLLETSVGTTSTINLEERGTDPGDAYIYPFLLQSTREFYYDPTNTLGETKIAVKIEEHLAGDAGAAISNFKTSGFILFDYEKVLNYRPKITMFFNTYNLEQIFGKNCLNSYYRIQGYNLTKKYAEYEGTAVNPDASKVCLKMEISGAYGECNVQFDPEQGQNFVSTRINASGGGFIKTKEYSYMRVLPFRQIRNGTDYKLIALELADLNTIDLRSQVRYELVITFADTTYQFYDTFIRKAVFTAFDKLEEYYEFANQFCSYNNIDNRFNDFFVNSVKENFEQPYPWEQAPIIYHSMRALLETSYETTRNPGIYTKLNRKKDGSLINMTILKKQAILDSKSIGPDTGDLGSLESFYNSFENLKSLFEKGTGLDAGSAIYDPVQQDYVLKQPLLQDGIKRKHDFIQDYDIANYTL